MTASSREAVEHGLLVVDPENGRLRCQVIAPVGGGRAAMVMTDSDTGGILVSEIVDAIGRAYDWPGYA